MIEVLSLFSDKQEFDRAQRTLYYLDFKRELLERIHSFEMSMNVHWFRQAVRANDMELIFNLYNRILDLFSHHEFEEVYLTHTYKKLKSDIDAALLTLFV